MSTLNEYLAQKRERIFARREAAQANPELKPNYYKASVVAKGRSGVREIRIREHQIISDSPEDFAGYNLGPTSPEMQLGVLGSCLTHVTLMQAAERGVSLDSLEVEITGETHPLAGKPGYEQVPIYPHNIRYKLYIQSAESQETIEALRDAVERVCPIMNLLKLPQQISGEIVRSPREQ